MTRDEIINAIKAATGDPASGAVADATPAIADAIDALANPTPETNTKTKNKNETRLMTPTGDTR